MFPKAKMGRRFSWAKMWSLKTIVSLVTFLLLPNSSVNLVD